MCVQRQMGDVALRFLHDFGAAPEASAGIGINAVIDLNSRDGQRLGIRRDAQHWHIIVRFQSKFAARCLGQSRTTFEIMIQPQRHGDRDLGDEAMIQMRRPTVARGLILNERIGAIHVIHPAMEIIRAAAMQHRAFDERRITLKTQRATEDFHVALDLLLLSSATNELVRLPTIALPAHARHSDLHAIIRARHIHR